MGMLSRTIVVLCALFAAGTAVQAQDPVEALMDTDRAFAAHSSEHGLRAAFLEYMAENAVVLRASGAPLAGRAAYAEATANGGDEGELDWAPEQAAVSDDGTLGYTWGYYVHTALDEKGAAKETRGKYLSVWRLQEDGTWKFIADIGNVDASGESPDPAHDR